MELAGLAVAFAIHRYFPPSTHPRPLVICGPGNNGGDGMVAIRHLSHFGYKPVLVYPKKTEKAPFQGLLKQCKTLNVEVLDLLPDSLDRDFHIIVDAIFGYSFSGKVREPFDKIIQDINKSHLPVVSIDIPSGWDVEKGDESGNGLKPTMLVSLTAPKLCAKDFKGKYHVLGGRFVPPYIAEKYQLNLPKYPEADPIVALE